MDERKTVLIPIAAAGWPILSVSVPMSEADWAHMMDTLNLMKVGIVADTEEAHDGD